MNVRERFHAVMNFQPFDRLPMIEWASWWDKTIQRWHDEGGLPAGMTNNHAIYDYLGLDMYMQYWIWAGTGDLPQPQSHGMGIINSQADYDRLRPMMYPRNGFDQALWRDWAKKQATGEAVLWCTFDGAFWWPRWLLGIEPHMYAFYDHADLMHQIIDDLTNFQLGLLDQIVAICKPDFISFAEDLSYNHGPMLSKEHFDEFLAPYYRRLTAAMKQHGIISIVDSDGDIKLPAEWFASVGVDGMLPLERQSGVDVAQLRRDHPRMRFIGCFDKMTMPHGEAAMRAEFERLLPVARQGGLIISVDHQTPPGVSFENYKIFLRLFKEYAEKAAR